MDAQPPVCAHCAIRRSNHYEKPKHCRRYPARAGGGQLKNLSATLILLVAAAQISFSQRTDSVAISSSINVLSTDCFVDIQRFIDNSFRQKASHVCFIDRPCNIRSSTTLLFLQQTFYIFPGLWREREGGGDPRFG